MATRKLPIGIQDFIGIRQDEYLYVDKTDLIHKMVSQGRSYFLSRPRRFGKSLLLSTLGAYLEGRRELFAGLALERLETEWTVYPVLRLDFNAGIYDEGKPALVKVLQDQLLYCAKKYGVELETENPASMFWKLVPALHERIGHRVCVLIDEYDKPLLATLGNSTLYEGQTLHAGMKSILKPFFGVLKSVDAHLKFAMLTGVTKFSQVSVFSDLNQLIDLTLHPDYATLCGITEEELQRNFKTELTALAEAQKLTPEACLEKTRFWYNGYRFEENSKSVYNPFSTLNLFERKKFESFWFATGTPTFLVELLKKSDYDLRDIDMVQLPAEDFANYRAEADRPIPVIYQSGYLTIKDYDPELRIYTLGYPNAEVKYGFLHFISADYLYDNRNETGLHIARFSQEIRAGDPEAFLNRLKVFFAGIPYELNDKTERHYQVVFYLVFKLLGQFVEAEISSAKGRADAMVSCKDYLYLFEFKLKGTAEEALRQIDEKGYLLPYAASGRTLYKIGVEFDPVARNLGRWIIRKDPPSLRS